MTTQASMRSNRKIGRADLAAASAERGLAMLDELRAELSGEIPIEVREDHERARRLLSDAAGKSGVTGFAIGEEAETPSPRGGGSG